MTTQRDAMNSREFDELAGRIEGVARMALALAANLETGEMIDGPHFSQYLRGCIKLTPTSPAHLHVAARTVRELAESLDIARDWRRFCLQAGMTEQKPTSRRKAG